jgi:hypothetical protein
MLRTTGNGALETQAVQTERSWAVCPCLELARSELSRAIHTPCLVPRVPSQHMPPASLLRVRF